MELAASRRSYAGLFMIALATLVYEILLTRIFSVTMWYHFAFVAVSVAMFGMTVGAVIVYLFPKYFIPERAKHQLAQSSLLFAVTTIISFLTHLSIPFVTEGSVVGVFSIALTYSVIAVPFVFSGIAVSLALTKFPRHVSRLYAADLAGAALGCILLIYILKVTDGPTAVIFTAALAGLGAWFFAADTDDRRLRRWALGSTLVLLLLAGVNTMLVQRGSSPFRLLWVKGELEERPMFERWNSFSRIKVYDDPFLARKPFGWGLSSVYQVDSSTNQLFLNIDANAGTVLTEFKGDFNDVEHLRYDVTNMAHYVRPDSRVLVVGVGGGRDVLSALAFKQKEVVGVEINDDIIEAMTGRFGDFTGHIERYPNVTLVNDEARSYVARSKEEFDIIQVSLIDTWAATAAGAFALTENSLYTLESWRIFLNHLSSDGILTFSRWYFRESPGEMYRITSLASASLMEAGIQDPRRHIVIVRNELGASSDHPDGVGTILVSRSPFSDAALDSISALCSRLNFQVVMSPRFAADSVFATLGSGRNLAEFTAQYPIDISPPTDNSPFFFHMLRLPDIFNSSLWNQGMLSFNAKAVFILGTLLMVVIVLTLLCIVVPLFLTMRRQSLKGSLPLFIFFASIGFGFMLVEISQMQRLTVFLGHPVYGLAVVLFAVLLSSGLGSYLTKGVEYATIGRSALVRIGALLGVLVLFGILTPYAVSTFEGATTIVRVAIAVAMLFPLGLFMGMAFPIGMKYASEAAPGVTPWLWGINGATSVCASVFAVAIALSSSISTSYWLGSACYVVALLAFLRAVGRKRAGVA